MNMDPNVINVILGITANGLTALIAGSHRKLGRKKPSETNTRAKFIPRLRRAIENVSDKIEWAGPPRVEELCLFLRSQEVEAVIRQLYTVRLFEEPRETLDSVKKEFLNLYAYTFELGHGEAEEAAGKIFAILSEATEKSLNAAVDNGDLPAHDAKSSIRFRILHEELVTLRKNVEFLTVQQGLSVNTINTFEARYLAQISSRHGRITPPNFDNARKLHIDSIYVSPKFIKMNSASYGRDWGRSANLNLIEMEPLLLRTHRVVILGNPGGGKTTLTHKLCYELSKRDANGNPQERYITPIPIILREYGAEKRSHNHPILQFIESTANDKYQISPPGGAFEYLLLNDRAAVIFDGLDELLETGYRQEIRDDIESFCNLYPSVPVIVTSREVGYEQAPLDGEKFDTYRLAPFDEGQVHEYVDKWFEVGTEFTPAQKQQKSRDFLRESQIVSDLRANPLMLGLMCNIYRGENYIPRNRPDVYRKCAEMLFERWDRGRDIPVSFQFEDDIRPAMAFLAHWIYSDPKLQEGVTEGRLISKAADYLRDYRFGDRDKAERAAREFIDFCRGRAWVFTEVGTDREGEGLYQFTHRTFLEFFTGVYLVRTHETTDALVERLLSRIRKREWDIVAQLSFQIKSKAFEGANDRLLLLLLEAAGQESTYETWNILSFAARCLEFMEPTPKVVRSITAACVEHCLAFGIEQEKKITSAVGATPVSPDHNPVDEVFRALVSTTGRSRDTIRETLKEVILNYLNAGSDQEALLAVEVGLHIERPLLQLAGAEEDTHNRAFWRNVSDTICAQGMTRIVDLSASDFALCLDAYKRQLVPIADLIAWHGPDGIFRHTDLHTFTGIREKSAAAEFVQNCVEVAYFLELNEEKERLISDLEYVGNVFLSALPVIKFRSADFDPPLITLIKDLPPIFNVAKKRKLSPATLFGLFVIYATWLEIYEAVPYAQRGQLNDYGLWDALRPSIRDRKVALLANLGSLLLSRTIKFESSFLKLEIERCGFNAQQVDFVRSWGYREIHLLDTRSIRAT